MDKKGVEAQQHREIQGTESDLRKLTMQELKEKLLSLGVEESKIDETDRWARVSLLREMSHRELSSHDECT